MNPVQSAPRRARVVAELGELPRLLAVVEAACDEHGVDADVRHDLLLMAEEACVNVIRHAYPAGQPGDVALSARLLQRRGAESLAITVEDHGLPFDPLAHAGADVAAPAEERALGGLGVRLIRQLADRLHYQHHPERGNVLVMEKDLAR